MRIDCYFTHQSCQEQDFNGRAAVVIDVLRATTTITAALGSGAKAVIPVAAINDALATKERLPEAILSGEREGERLTGFDMGNSPLEFTPEAVAGRLIISCTTNGTVAIQKARAATLLLLGALINAQAVAQRLIAAGQQDVAIVCAGTDGAPGLDDMMGAGAIIARIGQAIPLDGRDLNDAALCALRLYESYAEMDMHQTLALSRHGQRLIRCGRGADVSYCAQQDISPLTPWLDQESGYICG